MLLLEDLPMLHVPEPDLLGPAHDIWPFCRVKGAPKSRLHNGCHDALPKRPIPQQNKHFVDLRHRVKWCAPEPSQARLSRGRKPC